MARRKKASQKRLKCVEVRRAVWSSFHSLPTKMVRQTEMGGGRPVSGCRACSQSTKKTSVVHCRCTIWNTTMVWATQSEMMHARTG